MPKLKILSVAEDNYHTDRIACYQDSYPHEFAGPPSPIKLMIDSKGNATFSFARHTSNVANLDIDGLIEFLQQAKEFVSESKMIEILKGNND